MKKAEAKKIENEIRYVMLNKDLEKYYQDTIKPYIEQDIETKLKMLYPTPEFINLYEFKVLLMYYNFLAYVKEKENKTIEDFSYEELKNNHYISKYENYFLEYQSHLNFIISTYRIDLISTHGHDHGSFMIRDVEIGENHNILLSDFLNIYGITPLLYKMYKNNETLIQNKMRSICKNYIIWVLNTKYGYDFQYNKFDELNITVNSDFNMDILEWSLYSQEYFTEKKNELVIEYKNLGV